MQIGADEGDTVVTIVGYGLTVTERFELAPGIHLDPSVPAINLDVVVQGAQGFHDYAAVISGHPIASFCVTVENSGGARQLSAKAWNTLWVFHLLSVACRAPCFSLYSVTSSNCYRSANRNTSIRALNQAVVITMGQRSWAKKHYQIFDGLITDPQFSTAMRCFGNAHYLFDSDLRMMLLWSGIEGLLSVDAELSRRVALYASLMLEGSGPEKMAYYSMVKKAYGIRSKAVHGGRIAKDKMDEGYRTATEILSMLLARCVELGRVPGVEEFDAAALTHTLT